MHLACGGWPCCGIDNQVILTGTQPWGVVWKNKHHPERVMLPTTLGNVPVVMRRGQLHCISLVLLVNLRRVLFQVTQAGDSFEIVLAWIFFYIWTYVFIYIFGPFNYHHSYCYRWCSHSTLPPIIVSVSHATCYGRNYHNIMVSYTVPFNTATHVLACQYLLGFKY